MSMIRELKRNAWQIVVPVFGACLTFYFVYHAIQGNHGVFAWLSNSQQLERERTVLAQLESERSAVAERVRLLKTESLDTDLLDEQARRMGGLARPEDRIILLDNIDRQ